MGAHHIGLHIRNEIPKLTNCSAVNVSSHVRNTGQLIHDPSHEQMLRSRLHPADNVGAPFTRRMVRLRSVAPDTPD